MLPAPFLAGSWQVAAGQTATFPDSNAEQQDTFRWLIPAELGPTHLVPQGTAAVLLLPGSLPKPLQCSVGARANVGGHSKEGSSLCRLIAAELGFGLSYQALSDLL